MSELKFLSYNIMLKPSELLILNNEFKAERSKLFVAQYLANFDVVCFQETFDTAHSIKERLLESASEMGFGFFVKSSPPPLTSTFTVDGGLTVLSRLPIVDSEEMQYLPGFELDRIASKGCLYAALEVAPGRKVHVFNTHTQAHYCFHGEQSVYLYRLRRLTQLAQLKAFIAKVLKEKFAEGDLAVLCGDFNVDWNTEEMYRDYQQVISKINDVDGIFGKNFETEYDLVMELFSFKNEIYELKNMFLEQNGRQAVTYADYDLDALTGEKVPKETVLTSLQENCVRNGFDYIFSVQMKDESGAVMEPAVGFKDGSCRVEEFKTDVGFLTHLSDHYGISIVIKY